MVNQSVQQLLEEACADLAAMRPGDAVLRMESAAVLLIGGEDRRIADHLRLLRQLLDQGSALVEARTGLLFPVVAAYSATGAAIGRPAAGLFSSTFAAEG